MIVHTLRRHVRRDGTSIELEARAKGVYGVAIYDPSKRDYPDVSPDAGWLLAHIGYGVLVLAAWLRR